MFIISLTYKVPLEQVERYLEDHITYLDEQYQLGNFIASGKKVPRTGGVIFSKMENKQVLMEVLVQDPFYKFGLADFDVIEFIPSKTSTELSYLLEE